MRSWRTVLGDYGLLTCQKDKILREIHLTCPRVNVCGLYAGRIASAYSKCREDLSVKWVVGGAVCLGLVNRVDSFFIPCYGYGLRISEACLAHGQTVFDQIFDELLGEAKLVVYVYETF